MRKVISVSPTCGYCEQLVIGPQGHIYPCHLLEGAIGHIDDMPLQQFLPRLRVLAKRHQVGYLKTCNSCDLRNACGGTCQIVNESLKGSKFIPICSSQDRAEKLRNLIHWQSQYSAPNRCSRTNSKPTGTMEHRQLTGKETGTADKRNNSALAVMMAGQTLD